MVESRRRALTAFGVFVGCAAATDLLPSLLAQRPSGQVPNIPARAQSNGRSRESEVIPTSNGAAQADQNVEFQSSLRAEVEKLCAMANELKEEIVRINPRDTLSIAFLRKAQAIEKLAKQIKDHARG